MPAYLQPEQLELAREWQRQCWTQARIAKELGVDQSTVSRSLSRLNRRALKRIEKRVAEAKAKQVDQLEWLLEEAVGAWLHSKTPKQVEKTVAKDGGNDDSGGGGMSIIETSTHHCDAALLNQARGAMADIRNILGINAPTKSESEVKQSGGITTVILNKPPGVDGPDDRGGK